jgi:hypothetical protein
MYLSHAMEVNKGHKTECSRLTIITLRPCVRSFTLAVSLSRHICRNPIQKYNADNPSRPSGDSISGIQTNYVLDVPGFMSRQGQEVLPSQQQSTWAVGPPSLLLKEYRGSFLR